MKTFKILFIITLMSFLFTFISCSGGSDPVADTYIPDLSAANGWVNVNSSTDKLFFLTLPPQGSASGNFAGNRAPGTPNSTTFTGNYNHSIITNLVFDNMNDRPFTGNINGSNNPVIITISTPAKGANPSISLSYKPL